MILKPIILAGGAGTRLWPISRKGYPKQFLSLTDGRSLLQQTAVRLAGINGISPPTVVCNETHKFLVRSQLNDINLQPSSIIVEPEGRNTAPALTLAALQSQEMSDDSGKDTILLSCPADHKIRDINAFQAAMSDSVSIAQQGYIVTYGELPTSPNTGMGYIAKGNPLDQQHGNPVYLVKSFVEKPDLSKASLYMKSGYYWNTGIFMIKTSIWLSEIERYRPDILEACTKAFLNGHQIGDFYQTGVDAFVKCPSDSIDYAVIEKHYSTDHLNDSESIASKCVVVPMDLGWSDIGDLSSLWKSLEQDEHGNAIDGDVLSESTTNSLLISQSRLITSLGLNNMVVVETSDAVLVARKDSVQNVKQIVEHLDKTDRPESDEHKKVHRPWGYYQILDSGEGFQVKRLNIYPQSSLSLQFHEHRTEHWVVVNGTGSAVVGNEEFPIKEKDSVDIPTGVKHQVKNLTDLPLEIIEVQTGDYLGEDDITRLEDDYYR